MTDTGYLGPAEISVRFCCANCGALLQIKGGKAQLGAGHDPLEIGPRRTVHIVPCSNCIEKEVGPAKALRLAIAGLLADEDRK